MSGISAASAVPKFDVGLEVPDIARWRAGNTGIPGFTSFASSEPGPHVLLLALAHGNEIAGAIALDRLLRDGPRPRRGRLSFGFVNLAAFDRFDPQHPTLSRFVDEDMNRVWDPALLDSSRRSCELDRAREIRPLIDNADILFDLHSMLWPSDPLILCGETEKGRRLACAIGIPGLVVSDRGHVGGRRLIDYPRFADPDTEFVGNLLEAGQHWEPGTVEMMLAATRRLLIGVGLIDADRTDERAKPPPPRCAEVTVTVTASTATFSFVQPWRGGEVIARRNTLIALDGTTEIRTPYDECLLVMPSLRPSRGHTAVRLARFI
ncbi:MAG TPA: succinylglutamate desuccinylase/aspartoacylase family protein [Acetobacteraceae bacterium]|nr:succinylglutamate desuccinylase/aspartoacylase family protein [Acetobacteraceae bacterium]